MSNILHTHESTNMQKCPFLLCTKGTCINFSLIGPFFYTLSSDWSIIASRSFRGFPLAWSCLWPRPGLFWHWSLDLIDWTQSCHVVGQPGQIPGLPLGGVRHHSLVAQRSAGQDEENLSLFILATRHHISYINDKNDSNIRMY